MTEREPSSEASVLIVDDAPANLLALEAVLEPVGVKVVAAQSGAEAIALAEASQFALILLDVQMPGMDGFEVARRLRGIESCRETPIIFLTAIHRDEHYARTGYQVGAADYLLKPFDPDILRARVRSFVDLFNQREHLRVRHVQTRTRERDEAIRQLVAFERIATAALESANLDAFLGTLLDVFREAVDSVDAAGILVREGERLEARASLGTGEGSASGFSELIGEGFAGTIAASGRAMHLPDVSASPLVRSPWLKEQRLRGLLGVPLVVDGEVFGVAYIGSLRVSDFAESERRLFAAVTERAASAAFRVRARRQVEQLLEAEKLARREAEAGARRQRFLAEVSAVLVSSLDVEATLAKVAGLTVPWLADSCTIDLLDDEGARCRRAEASGGDAKAAWAAFAGSQAALDDVDRVIASKEASVALGAEPDWLDDDARALAGHVGLHSWMCLPLRRPSRAIGALSLARGAPAGPYSEADCALAEEVAVRIAMAVENADLYRKAQLAIRIREEFVSIASHELKTPLTPLKLQLASLRRRPPQDPKVLGERLAIADRQVDKIDELVSQLLDVSKIAGGRLDLEPRWIDLGAVLGRVVERFATNAASSPVSLSGESPPALLDPFRIEQLVTNLVGNAVKYGEGKPIEIDLSSDGQRARIAVRDWGIGIARRAQARIFERFERAVSPREYGGFGLGLWIARQVVEASGGEISVRSEVGKGAEFTVLLPLEGMRDARVAAR